MNTMNILAVVLRIIAVALPILLALGAVFASRARPFRTARVFTWLAAGLAAIVALAGPWLPAAATGIAAVDAAVGAVRLDLVTSAMLLLVGGLSVVILRYSDTYLQGDGGRLRYVRALSLTLAAVFALVVTENLLVLSLAWTGSSVALHLLLTHFPDRIQARVAAHKKFILSRIADACVLAATALVYSAVGSVQLGAIQAFIADSSGLPLALQGAALLIVAAVTLKTAQLPFHGWLTQVMEAPTPVSALLHAGVVNIGGFVLIRLAALMGASLGASTLLVVVGTVTAVVAALIMTTRVSVKVNLAWSTAAQMGLMLVQCGLGLWHLALLHLLAHSVYKAHAFLSAGGTVEAWRIKVASPKREPVPFVANLVAVLVTVPVTLGLSWAVGLLVGEHGGLGPLSILIGLALAPMLARVATSKEGGLLPGIGAAFLIVGLYLGWHTGFELLHLSEPASLASSTLGWAFVVPGFLLLFLTQIHLAAAPSGALARRLQPHLFAGLYLDALFTRMTFRVWPPRVPPRRPALPQLAPDAQES